MAVSTERGSQETLVDLSRGSLQDAMWAGLLEQTSWVAYGGPGSEGSGSREPGGMIPGDIHLPKWVGCGISHLVQESAGFPGKF